MTMTEFRTKSFYLIRREIEGGGGEREEDMGMERRFVNRVNDVYLARNI